MGKGNNMGIDFGWATSRRAGRSPFGWSSIIDPTEREARRRRLLGYYENPTQYIASVQAVRSASASPFINEQAGDVPWDKLPQAGDIVEVVGYGDRRFQVMQQDVDFDYDSQVRRVSYKLHEVGYGTLTVDCGPDILRPIGTYQTENKTMLSNQTRVRFAPGFVEPDLDWYGGYAEQQLLKTLAAAKTKGTIVLVDATDDSLPYKVHFEGTPEDVTFWLRGEWIVKDFLPEGTFVKLTEAAFANTASRDFYKSIFDQGLIGQITVQDGSAIPYLVKFPGMDALWLRENKVEMADLSARPVGTTVKVVGQSPRRRATNISAFIGKTGTVNYTDTDNVNTRITLDNQPLWFYPEELAVVPTPPLLAANTWVLLTDAGLQHATSQVTGNAAAFLTDAHNRGLAGDLYYVNKRQGDTPYEVCFMSSDGDHVHVNLGKDDVEAAPEGAVHADGRQPKVEQELQEGRWVVIDPDKFDIDEVGAIVTSDSKAIIRQLVESGVAGEIDELIEDDDDLASVRFAGDVNDWWYFPLDWLKVVPDDYNETRPVPLQQATSAQETIRTALQQLVGELGDVVVVQEPTRSAAHQAAVNELRIQAQAYISAVDGHGDTTVRQPIRSKLIRALDNLSTFS